MAGTTGTSAEPYLYAGAWGYRSDGDAGLMLVGARCYDAQAGRFVTRDTLLGEHPYLYCEHEPVGSVDPSGHKWSLQEILHQGWDYIWGGVGAAVGATIGGGPNNPVGIIGGIVGAGLGGMMGEALWQMMMDPVPVPAPLPGSMIAPGALT